MYKWIIAVTLASAVSLPAEAQMSRNCADRARVLEVLDDGYGERREAFGLAANNHVIEVFASLENGTWTITATSPEGKTCILASGNYFERAQNDLAGAEGDLL